MENDYQAFGKKDPRFSRFFAVINWPLFSQIKAIFKLVATTLLALTLTTLTCLKVFGPSFLRAFLKTCQYCANNKHVTVKSFLGNPDPLPYRIYKDWGASSGKFLAAVQREHFI